jgi:tetratricopeptide (TPR) repeat protein
VSSVGLQQDEAVRSRPAGLYAALGRHPYLLGLLLTLLSVALYYPVKSHPFVNYDDNVYVTDNLPVQNGLTWDTVTWAFRTYDAGNWHPLTWLSHALDVDLFDVNPAGHHGTSMVLHALNAALLFWVLLRATGGAGRSFVVAALFAVHPINVESVVWVAERKTVLSMFFFLLALGVYGWYAAKPKGARYAAVTALFACGLMAKPQVITFPFVLLLWDYWPLERVAFRSSPFAIRQSSSDEISGEKRTAKSQQRLSGEERTANGAQQLANSPRQLLIEKLPLFALAAASAAITMKAQRASRAVLSLDVSPLPMRLSNALVSYVKYLRKAFWPTNLAPMYPYPGAGLRAWQVFGALLVLLAITVFVVRHRRRRYLLVGWLWFLGTLVPMIGLVQVGRQAMADRYAYLPLLGIFIMLCWGVSDWAEEKHLPAAFLPTVSIAVLLGLSVTARRQIGYWGDNVTLWTHTVEVTPPNYVAQDNLGGALMASQRLEEAIVHFREAAAIHPVDPYSAFNIGFYEHTHGDLRGAIEQYKKAIALSTSTALKATGWDNMGRAYRSLGEAGQAQACFEKARELQGQEH